MAEHRQVFLDTETTGLNADDGDRVIEIGAVELVDGMHSKEIFHELINPQRSISAGSSAIHGHTTQKLRDKPLFKDIVDQFIDFIRDAEIVIHNAPFDVGFLNNEFRMCGITSKLEDFCRKITDSYLYAQSLHPNAPNSLDSLCNRYNVKLKEERELHGALLDAQLLTLVYQAMQLQETGGLLDQVSEAHTVQIDVSGPIVRAGNATIIKPTEEELAAHDAYMKEINPS